MIANYSKMEKRYPAKIMKNSILHGGVTVCIANLSIKSMSKQSLSWGSIKLCFIILLFKSKL